MKKDVHIYIDYDLSNVIDKISKTNKMTLSNTYNVLLKNGLTICDINYKLDTDSDPGSSPLLFILVNISICIS